LAPAQQLAPTTSTNVGPEDKNKPIDRRQFLDFLMKVPNDEADVEKLTECLEYMRYQVQQKREELMQMEKDIT
jgi:hypothetical protein